MKLGLDLNEWNVRIEQIGVATHVGFTWPIDNRQHVIPHHVTSGIAIPEQNYEISVISPSPHPPESTYFHPKNSLFKIFFMNLIKIYLNSFNLLIFQIILAKNTKILETSVATEIPIFCWKMEV